VGLDLLFSTGTNFFSRMEGGKGACLATKDRSSRRGERKKDHALRGRFSNGPAPAKEKESELLFFSSSASRGKVQCSDFKYLWEKKRRERSERGLTLLENF